MGRRRSWVKLLIAMLAVAAIAWLIAKLGPRAVARVALQADPWWLLASLVPLTGRFLIWGTKWKRILARRAPVSFRSALEIQLAGSFVNLTTPTAKLAGGFLRALIVRKRFGWTLSESYGRAFADQATTLLGTVLLFGLLTPFLLFLAPTMPYRSIVILLSAGSLIGIGLLLALRRTLSRWVRHPRLARWLTRVTPSRFRIAGEDASWIEPVFYPFLEEGRTLQTLGSDLILGASAFAMVCLSNALVMRSLGVETSLTMISAAVVIGYFIGIAVSAWGGVGVTEAALAGLYIQMGVPPEAAAAGAILHRASFYLMVLGWGGWCFSRVGAELAASGRGATADLR